MSAPRLSALVVARNEEAQLADCLGALAFADEIVVVLDRSTDGSKAIAERMAHLVLEGAWEIEGARRNAGLDVCTGDWILEVDADERVTPALAEEVRATIATATAPAHYLIPFDNYIGKHLVRYGWGGSWGVSATTRLFSRGAKRWGDQRIHPAVTLEGEGRRLKTPMVHYVDANISDMLRRLDRYTTARARDMRANGTNETFGRNFRRIFTRFFKCYVRRKGYKEGYWGFLVALMAAVWPMLAWLKYRLEDE
ncbi:MAG: glycosyltransferase family 2 protein [Rhodospirillaceae bacterium]|nr:glycosyltransferase family 2 protein [Rhodospirillaceae bacterium]